MRHPRSIIALLSVVVVLGVVIALGTTGGSAAPAKGAVSTSKATIHMVNAVVAGKSEAILVNGNGLPLYIYKADTAKKSFVTGGLAALWPPLASSRPRVVGASGTAAVAMGANGAQVTYNGHFLYTFVSDSVDRVTGQGIQGFFVATPGLAPIGAASSASPTPVPASTGSHYGY